MHVYKGGERLLPSKGRLLIVEPFADDDFFSRAVVLLLTCNADDCMGLVLNKPLDVGVGEVFSDADFLSKDLYLGGPVDDGVLFCLHTIPNVNGAERVCDRLYVGGEMSEILLALQGGASHYVRFFRGYAGWAPGQLDQEIGDGEWMVSDCDLDLLTVDDVDMWRRALQSVGDDRCLSWLNSPIDPSLN